MNWECPNKCSLVLLMHPTRTYWDHRHNDAHGCEHGGGHCAALIGQSDTVVTAEESSLVRREGRFVQKHGDNQHYMIGQIWAQVRKLLKNQNIEQLHQQILTTGSQTEMYIKVETTEVPDTNKKHIKNSCIPEMMHQILFSMWHWCREKKMSPDEQHKICWNKHQNQSSINVLN